MLWLTSFAQAVPTIVVGIHFLQPNLAGQTIPINVTGISANEVNGITLSVAINDGGPSYGGTLGPSITDMDFDSGPTIWVPPSVPTGHNAPATFFDGQLATANFLTVSGFVTASSGLVATLTIDTTGIAGGDFTLDLVSLFLEENIGNTGFIGNIVAESITNGTIVVDCPRAQLRSARSVRHRRLWRSCNPQASRSSDVSIRIGSMPLLSSD